MFLDDNIIKIILFGSFEGEFDQAAMDQFYMEYAINLYELMLDALSAIEEDHSDLQSVLTKIDKVLPEEDSDVEPSVEQIAQIYGLVASAMRVNPEVEKYSLELIEDFNLSLVESFKAGMDEEQLKTYHQYVSSLGELELDLAISFAIQVLKSKGVIEGIEEVLPTQAEIDETVAEILGENDGIFETNEEQPITQTQPATDAYSV